MIQIGSHYFDDEDTKSLREEDQVSDVKRFLLDNISTPESNADRIARQIVQLVMSHLEKE